MFGRIDPKELNQNVFSMIGEQWMLVTAGTAERCNTMTASWGGLGVLWGKPVATVYIRPSGTPWSSWSGRLLHPLLLRGGVPEGPGPVRLQERPGRG